MQVSEVESQKIWKPNKRQEEFLRIPYSIFEALYGGAVFGGKTELLLMLPLLLKVIDEGKEWNERESLIQHPDFNCIMFRRTFPQLEESLIDRSIKDGFYEAAGGKYNKQDHVWTFPSKATVRFSYCEEDKHARAHDTSEFQLMCFDEVTHFTEYQYKYLTHRVRTGKKGLPAIVRVASNPGNIGHNWVRERFVDPAPEGNKVIADKYTQTKRIFIPARLFDNKIGLENNPDYVNKLAVLPEADRKAKMDGDWYVFSGQVFTEFRHVRRLDEPENALHVIEPFKIPDWWPKLLFIDWGYVHSTYAAWAALTPDERVIQYREYKVEQTKVSVWAADIARLSQFDENIIHIGIDPSAWQERGLDKNVAQQFMDASGLMCEPANNDRLGGKMNFHDFLRWKPKPPRYVPREGYDAAKAERIFRLAGDKAKQDYLDAFTPQKEETNLPRFQIFNTCPEIINCIELCVYDEKHQGKPGVKAEDVAKFVGDDPYDCVRYLLMEADRYYRGLADEYKIYRERERILSLRDKSLTAMHMELLKHPEVFSGEIVKPARRHFH